MKSEFLRRPFILIALCVLLILLPADYFGYSLLPQNPEQYLTQPGKEPVGYFSRDPTGSVIELAYAKFSRDQLRRHVIPLWSPYQSLGHPFVADIPCSALFAPLNLLRLVIPPSYWDTVFILNLILGCWFVSLLASTYGLDRRSRMIAGLSLAALGTTQIYIQVSSVTLVATWIPLVLYGIELQLAPVRSRFSYIPLLAGLYGVATGGHPSVSFLAVLFVALYIGVRLIQVKPGAVAILRLVGLCTVGTVIAAAQWLPFVAYVRYHGNTFGDFSADRFRIAQAPAFIIPYLYGGLNSSVTDTLPAVNIGDYWSLGWLAPSLLIFFVAGFRPATRKNGAFALLFSSALIVAWTFGIPPFSLASNFPFFNRVRGFYGIVSIASVIPVLIGFGYQFLVRHPRKLRGGAIGTAIVLTLAGSTAAMTLESAGMAPQLAQAWILTRSLLTLAWVGAALAALLLLRARYNSRDYRARLFWVNLAGVGLSSIGFFPWGASDAILTAQWSTVASFCLVVGAAAFLPVMHSKLLPALAASVVITSGLAVEFVSLHLPRRHDLFAHGAYVDYLLQHQRPEYRSYGLDGFLFPNFGAANGISTVNVITGMLPSQVEQFFASYLDHYQGAEQIMGKGTSIPGKTPIDQFLANKRFWDYIGVRYLVTSEGSLTESAVPSVPASTVGTGDTAHPQPGSIAQLLVTPMRTQIECPAAPVNAVCFILGTYNNVNRGRLTVKALDEQAKLISEASVDSATIHDMACTRFEFPQNICSTGQKRILEISHLKAAPNSGIAVFRTPAVALASQVLQSRAPGLHVVFQDPVTQGRVWENRDAQPRAYLAPETGTAPNWRQAQEMFASAAGLRRKAFVESPGGACASNPDFPAGAKSADILKFDLAANSVSVQVNAFTSGTFVLVDTYVPGWTARVDGKAQRVFEVNGTFRGTCVASPGQHQIVFDYAPPEWKAGVFLSLAALAGFAGMTVFSLRKTSNLQRNGAKHVPAGASY